MNKSDGSKKKKPVIKKKSSSGTSDSKSSKSVKIVQKPKTKVVPEKNKDVQTTKTVKTVKTVKPLKTNKVSVSIKKTSNPVKPNTSVKKNVTKKPKISMIARHTSSETSDDNQNFDESTKSSESIDLEEIHDDNNNAADSNVESDDESNVESNAESDPDSEPEPEVELIEYEMDEYETKKAGSERHVLLKDTLFEKFGFRSFKPEQYKIIDNILDGKDVLGVMPTGYGKSLCFQLPPLVTNELSIVISPLIALMADQQDSMTQLGIKSCVYNSTIGAKQKKEIEDGLVKGEYQILYVTPESLDKPAFRKLVDKIYTDVGICMVAVDEAHCVSAYGFDFRPKYRNIAKIRKYIPDVPILAVTATATEKVSQDIYRNLDMQNSVLVRTSFDRPNLFINIKQIRQNTLDKICELIKSAKSKHGTTIVYCVTKKDTNNLNHQIKSKGIKTVAYHADLNKEQRTSAQEKFMKGKVECICATIAFGMGINKSNVRAVIHYGCPKNIESYYQEIGRAGRDGKESECWLFYRQSDFRIQNLLIEKIQDPVYKTTCKSLLYTMTKYITDKKCRRKELLKYFSEDYAKSNCEKCDNCCLVTKAINRKDEGDLFKILSTLLEMETEHGYTVGKNKLLLILKGSKAKDVTATMRNLPYYGSFADKKKNEGMNLIDTAIELGYIKCTNPRPGDTFMVLACTEYGLEFGKEYETKLNQIVQNTNKTTKEIGSKVKTVSKTKSPTKIKIK